MTPVYSDTCINRYALKRSTDAFRRTDTPDLVCFLYASLSHISKAETVKRTLVQRELFFSPQIKKATCLLPYKNFRNSEKQIIKLEIFVNFLKKKHFLHFKTGIILFDFILQFWRSTIYLSRSLYLFLHVALCNQPTVVLRHWKWYRKRFFKPYSTPPWTIAFSTVTYIGEVSMTCKRMH